MYQGIDIGSRIDAVFAKCLALDKSFVVRYLDDSWGTSAKSINENEINVLHDAGLGIFLVYETNPTYAAYFNRSQGIYDAQHAITLARRFGYPSGMPIFFAVDYDASFADLNNLDMVEYWNGVYDILTSDTGGGVATYTVGIYGGNRVIEHARTNWPAIAYYWQTYAWSAGVVNPHAHLFQFLNGTPTCGNHVVDLNTSLIKGWERNMDRDTYARDIEPFVKETLLVMLLQDGATRSAIGDIAAAVVAEKISNG